MRFNGGQARCWLLTPSHLEPEAEFCAHQGWPLRHSHCTAVHHGCQCANPVAPALAFAAMLRGSPKSTSGGPRSLPRRWYTSAECSTNCPAGRPHGVDAQRANCSIGSVAVHVCCAFKMGCTCHNKAVSASWSSRALDKQSQSKVTQQRIQCWKRDALTVSEEA